MAYNSSHKIKGPWYKYHDGLEGEPLETTLCYDFWQIASRHLYHLVANQLNP